MNRTFPPEIWGEIFLWIDLGSFRALTLSCRAFRCKLLKLKGRLIRGWLVQNEDSREVWTTLPNGRCHGFGNYKTMGPYTREGYITTEYYEFGLLKYRYGYIRNGDYLRVYVIIWKKKMIGIHLLLKSSRSPLCVTITDPSNKEKILNLKLNEFEVMAGFKCDGEINDVCQKIYHKFKNFAMINYVYLLHELSIPIRFHLTYGTNIIHITLHKGEFRTNFYNLCISENGWGFELLSAIIQHQRIVKFIFAKRQNVKLSNRLDLRCTNDRPSIIPTLTINQPYDNRFVMLFTRFWEKLFT